MDRYLAKPFAEAQLFATLAEWALRRDVAEQSEMASVTPKVPAANAIRSDKVKPAGKQQKLPKKPSKTAKPKQAEAVATVQAVAGGLNPGLESLRQTRPDVYRKLIRTYLEFTPHAVAGLTRMLRQQDCASLRLAAHGLSSSSANVGAARLSELCSKLEAVAGTSDIAKCKPIIAKIKSEFAAAAAKLESELAESASQKGVA